MIEASASDPGAFVDAFKLNMDTGIRNISNDLAFDLFSSGSGVRGVMSAISTGAITLTDPNAIVQFEVGQTLMSFDATNANQSTSNALGYVISVNRSAGTLVVSATAGGSAGTPTNWSTSFPNLIVQGDAVAGQTSMLKVTGIAGWLPFTTPASNDSFWGVNRSTDPTRLAGVRFDGSAETIEEAIIDGSSLVAREGGAPEVAWVNYASYSALEKALGSKVQYVSVRHDEADIAFDGIRINAPYGPINVIPDRNVTAQMCYLLSMDTWKLRSLGKCPHILRYGVEGLEGLRVGNADALEVRLGYYGNLVDITCPSKEESLVA